MTEQRKPNKQEVTELVSKTEQVTAKIIIRKGTRVLEPKAAFT